jgi:hypothetical protein
MALLNGRVSGELKGNCGKKVASRKWVVLPYIFQWFHTQLPDSASSQSVFAKRTSGTVY